MTAGLMDYKDRMGVGGGYQNQHLCACCSFVTEMEFDALSIIYPYTINTAVCVEGSHNICLFVRGEAALQIAVDL